MSLLLGIEAAVAPRLIGAKQCQHSPRFLVAILPRNPCCCRKSRRERSWFTYAELLWYGSARVGYWPAPREPIFWWALFWGRFSVAVLTARARSVEPSWPQGCSF